MVSYETLTDSNGNLLGYKETSINKKGKTEEIFVPPSKDSLSYKMAKKIRNAEQVGFVMYGAVVGMALDVAAAGVSVIADAIGQGYNPALQHFMENQVGPAETIAFLGLAGIGTLAGLAKWRLHGIPLIGKGSKQIARKYNGTEMQQVNPLVDKERARAAWSTANTIKDTAAISLGTVSSFIGTPIFGAGVAGVVYVGGKFAIGLKYYQSRVDAYKAAGKELKAFDRKEAQEKPARR